MTLCLVKIMIEKKTKYTFVRILFQLHCVLSSVFSLDWNVHECKVHYFITKQGPCGSWNSWNLTHIPGKLFLFLENEEQELSGSVRFLEFLEFDTCSWKIVIIPGKWRSRALKWHKPGLSIFIIKKVMVIWKFEPRIK